MPCWALRSLEFALFLYQQVDPYEIAVEIREKAFSRISTAISYGSTC